MNIKPSPFLAQYGSEKHLDQMFEKVHNFPSIAGSEIIRNPFATKKHLEQVPISDYNWADKHDLVKHPNIPDNHREDFLKSGNIGLQNALLRRSDTTKEHLKTILRAENTGPEIAENVAKHPLADSEVLHVGLDHPASYVRYNMIVDGKNLDRSHIERGLKDSALSVRGATERLLAERGNV